MTGRRSELLDRVLADVSENGLGDRSLRDLAAAVGSSHRMLHYHFGSRQGLVEAIVTAVEEAQRDLLVELADEIADPAELTLALWSRVSSPELRPFVRLFFECVAATGGTNLTEPWLESSPDKDLVRLGVAVTRGLLIDVLSTGETEDATRALQRFIDEVIA